ncbi:MAG: hypothetical protein E7335_05160 [Clostridiales bacterium]|nr:hypothetical protein [Clostridiales bacterium]
MDSRKIVYRETGIIALGQIICLALMLGIYALLGYLTAKVLWGALIGTVLAVANFFFMAVGASLAADKAELHQDVKGGTALIKSSYFIRLLVIFLILFACVKGGICDALASVLPLVFIRPIITIAEFFRKSGEAKS